MTTPPRLFDSARRIATLGILLVITVTALEAMAVATVMPETVRELHGLRYYGWAFTAFFITDVIGIVDAGSRTDRHGPTGPLLGGLGLFAAGLLVAGTAPDMPLFLLGRAVQGLGAGSLIVAIYVVVARGYPPDLRPRAFAALSAAWVVPALVGPALAGAVADAVGWRWVFLGIAPVAVLGTALLLPVVRGLPEAAPDAGPVVRRGSAFSGVSLAAGLTLMQLSGQQLSWWSLPALVGGLALLLPPLHQLLPTGALRLHRGLPTVVVLRGLLSASFFGAEAFLPLTLSQVHHFSPTSVGIPLTFGALGWSVGSYLQGRRPPEASPLPLLRVGFFLVAAAVAPLAALSSVHVSGWVAIALWSIGGLGMGTAMPTISVLTLRLSPEPEQGANSAALQVCDVTGSVLGVAAAGTVIALLHPRHFGSAIVIVDLALAAIAVVGALVARRAILAAAAPARPALART